MLVKSKIIILHTIPFKETSIIVYAYSQEQGRISFLVNGVRKKKSKTKLNIFQPLSIADIIYYSNEKNELCRIKEIIRNDIFNEIPFRIDKNTTASFISEVIYRIVREEVKNESLFEFLYYSILYLDKLDSNISIFNLIFLIQLTKYLGIKPNSFESDQNLFFNLESGHFTSIRNNETTVLNKKLSYYFSMLIDATYKESKVFKIERHERNELLKKIIQYYQIHLEFKIEIKSLRILEEVFN